MKRFFVLVIGFLSFNGESLESGARGSASDAVALADKPRYKISCSISEASVSGRLYAAKADADIDLVGFPLSRSLHLVEADSALVDATITVIYADTADRNRAYLWLDIQEGDGEKAYFRRLEIEHFRNHPITNFRSDNRDSDGFWGFRDFDLQMNMSKRLDDGGYPGHFSSSIGEIYFIGSGAPCRVDFSEDPLGHLHLLERIP